MAIYAEKIYHMLISILNLNIHTIPSTSNSIFSAFKIKSGSKDNVV